MESVTRIISKAIAYGRQQGIENLLRRCGEMVFRRSPYYAVMCKHLAACGDEGGRTCTGDVRFELLQGVRAEDVPRMPHPDAPPGQWPDSDAVLDRRLSAGEGLVLGWLGDRLVWRSWVLRRDWKLVPCRRDNEMFEICHCTLRCLKEFRRRGIARAAIEFVHGWATRNGYKTMWSYVRNANKASLAMHRGSGYELYGYVEFYTLMGWDRTRFRRPGGPLTSVAAATGASPGESQI